MSTISRLRTVTRLLPIWPAIRMPFSTRDGDTIPLMRLIDQGLADAPPGVGRTRGTNQAQHLGLGAQASAAQRADVGELTRRVLAGDRRGEIPPDAGTPPIVQDFERLAEELEEVRVQLGIPEPLELTLQPGGDAGDQPTAAEGAMPQASI